jgi:FG-GAP repeat/HYR domain
VRLRLKGVGFGEQLAPVAAPELHRQGKRIEYRRGALTEWYVNDKQGLEQGFTLATRPSGATEDARLRLSLAVSGDLKASASADGAVALLKDAKGAVVLRYSDLKAWDAAKRELSAALIVKADEIGISVDDREAVYPLTIDPVFSQVQKLTDSDGVPGDQFGTSVSISGDTIVVGAYTDDTARGAAYVFERNKGGGDIWGEVTKLTASDGAPVNFFGTSVSISGDTILVGANWHDSSRGEAYVYERNHGGANLWGEVAKLTASDSGTGYFFGTSVSISGDTVVVGANGTNSNRGSAYVFTRNKGGADLWGQVRKLLASDGAAVDFFGSSVSISDDTIVVGATGDDSSRGAAYVYERNHGGAEFWGQVTKLIASDGAAGDFLGLSVLISGDTIVAGALDDDSSRGAAYVFERNQGGADIWGEVAKLTASDGVADDRFGTSVSISGDTIVAGADARGGVYVFGRNQGGADNWGEVKRLTAAGGGPDDAFGYSVSISGDSIVVGAYADDSGKGSAYVFANDCGEWTQIAKPESSDKGAADQFGFQVAISGDTAVVTAPEQEEGPGDNDSGAAYVFERNQDGANQWGQVRKLLSSDNAIGDAFGSSVAISGDTIIVGAREEDDPGFDSGAAYIFGRNQGGADNWGEIKKIEASDKAAGDNFGTSVGISGDTAIVGAHLEDDPGLESGAAYIFQRNQGGANNWGEVKKIEASDIENLDFFGFAVAISGDTAIVAAPLEDDPGNSGTAYIFERNQGGADNWGEVKKIKASDKEMGDRFAFAVALSGDTVIVGAPREDDAGIDAGAAYIFERNQGGADNWGEVTRLASPDVTGDNFFGYAVSISVDTAIVGAPRDDFPGVESGAAYLFERNQGGADNWGQVRKIEGSDIEDKDQFGAAVGISGDTVIVGAPAPVTSKTGASYIFVTNCPPIITPQTVTRQQGAAAVNSTIATVLDDLTPAGSITVTLNGSLPTGITVTNLQNTSGTITADVAADCAAALGDHLIGLLATDEHGLTSTASFTVTVSDTTPPDITCPDNVIAYLPLNSMDTEMVVNYPSPTATDDCGAPIITTSQDSGTVFPLGTTTVDVTATDAVGNQSSCTFTVTVSYNLSGFFQPVENLPAVNLVKGGSAVPIKFSLSGNKGLDIFAPGYPASQQVACDSSAPVSDIEDTVTAGSSSLSYDPTSDQYKYVWMTDRAWAGTCRQLIVKLKDGSTLVANFQFK